MTDTTAAVETRTRAETLRDLIEGVRYYRGRLSKVTLDDYAVVLATLDGDFPSDAARAHTGSSRPDGFVCADCGRWCSNGVTHDGFATHIPASGSEREAREDLPDRIVVDQHGHYWRDYGAFLSMPPVSDENNRTEVAAVYVRAVRTASRDGSGPARYVASGSEREAGLDVERLAEIVSDSLAATTEGTDWAEAPEPSDEPGSPYVMRLTNEIFSRLRSAAPTGASREGLLREARIEGEKELFRELVGADPGGFLPASAGLKDGSGKADDGLPVGWIFRAHERVLTRLAAQSPVNDEEGT